MDAMESALEMIRPHLGGIVAGSLPLHLLQRVRARQFRCASTRRGHAAVPLCRGHHLPAGGVPAHRVLRVVALGFDTQWMKEGWTESGQNSRVSPMSEKKRFERLFLYALFGYMIKVRAGAVDLTPTDNASLHEQCSSFRPTRARVTPAPSNAPSTSNDA